jgi:preprotein translocase subunit SecA
MVSILKRFLDTNEKQIATARKVVEKINALEPEVEKMSLEDIQKRIVDMRAELFKLRSEIPESAFSSLRRVDHTKPLPKYELAIQNKLHEFLPEVYAFIREVYKREMGIRLFDVQLVAGVILAQGQKLTENKTGEGKTYVFNLPLILYSLVGRGAHLVTVNDYLARRDGENVGHIANKLGLTVGIVAPNQVSYKFIDNEEVKTLKGDEAYKEVKAVKKLTLSGMHGLNLVQCEKREAYNCDITVSVNSELGFDYLRDNMAPDTTALVQRELYFCIVDEADSILIDEARTPLIISATPSESDTEKYAQLAEVVEKLGEDTDYEVDHKTRTVVLTEEGIRKVEEMIKVDNVWSDFTLVHHLDNALKAKAMYHRDDQYLVRDGEVLIVDSFTGRVMPGRRFSEGLHQAIEAKEHVQIQQESQTYATITFQNFFRLYKILCGGSGTILTEAEEFYKIYHLESVVIPTNKPVIRDDKNDLIYRNQNAKFKAVASEIKELNAKGQPVLVGTTSIEKSELLSSLLDAEGIAHTVLNAKYHEREAQIVAKAGQKGAVTVATNMAGRGTDIPLGDGVRDLGGLAVLGTERHEARRIDNQLRGRSGRQGDPGYTRFYVALDDTIMKVLGGDFFTKSIGRVMDDDMPIELGLISRQIESAQKRIESLNFDSRKQVVDYDDVINNHREVFYTRRRKIASLGDRAMGRFTQDELSKFKPDELEARRESARNEVEAMMTEIVLGELDNIIDAHFKGESKLDEKSVTGLVANVLDLAPDLELAKVFDTKATQLEGKLKDELRGKQIEDARAYLEPAISRLIKAKFAEFGDDLPLVAKTLMLEDMDKQWMDHLETMTDIRSGIGLQGYAQRDPLVEYKNVAFRTFSNLMQSIDTNVARRVLKITKVARPTPTVEIQGLQTNQSAIEDILTGDREMLPEEDSKAKGGSKAKALINKNKRANDNLQRQILAVSGNQATIRKPVTVGRNDPCPCGSGLKYKKCGLLNTPEHQKRMQSHA